MITLLFCLFIHAGITALIINGIDLVTSKDYLFYPLRVMAAKLNRTTFKFLYAPVIGCVVCMASVWGTLSWWGAWMLFEHLTLANVFIFYIPFLLMLSYMNAVMAQLVPND